MTLVEDRPVDTPSALSPAPAGRSAFPAWRFAARLARREVRRRPGRTVLVALLVAVPVMAMTLGSILARTNVRDWTADFQRDYGDADIVTGMPWIAGAATDDAAPPVPAGGTVLGEYVMVSTYLTPRTAAPGLIWADVTDLDPSNPAEWNAVEVTDGSAPAVGEVMLDPDLAAALGVDIGDRLDLERPSGSWIVSGFGRMRGDYWRRLAVLPGFDVTRIVPEQRFVSTLIDLPDSVTPDEVNRLAAERNGLSRYQNPFTVTSDLATGMAWGYVAGVLALVAVGIVVAAAFATSARRQLVTIGQLSANGAPESVVRRSLSLQGTWSAVVGVAVGMAAGFALLPVARPLVAEHIVQHELRGSRVALGDLIVIAVTAIVVATVAASVPAKSASRVPVMAALAGRRPVGSPPAWLVPTGVALFGGGLGLVALAAVGAAGSSGSPNTWAAIVVLGATGMVFGVCCASPLVVERVGRLGHRRSLSWRLALRSLGRNRARNAAVVAAIAVAAGGAVAGSAVAESAIRSNDACCDPNLPADTIVAMGYVTDDFDPAADLVDRGPLGPFESPAAIDALADELGGSTFPVLTATFDPVAYDPESNYIDNHGPVIATPELLDVIGLDPADARTLRETGVLGQSYIGPYAEGDGVPTTMVYEDERGAIELDVPTNQSRSAYPWISDIMMTESAARAAGFDIVPTGLMIRTGAPLTPEQILAVRDAAQTVEGRPLDAFVEPGDPTLSLEARQMGVEPSGVYLTYEDPAWHRGGGRELWIARGVIVGVALVLSMLVVSIGLSLAAAEGRDERDTFAVVGATPASMRRQAAARAAVMTLVGIGLGIPLGFTPAWVVDRITRSGDGAYAVPVQFPWLVVAAMLVVITAAAAGGAWAGSGLAQRFRPASATRRD